MKRLDTIRLLFLELLSLTPILIILGNIVPPCPIKIHLMGFGIIFLLAIILLAADSSKKWILYLSAFYLIVQLFSESWAIKDVIDFFFGPFVFLVMIDMLVNKKLPSKTLKNYELRFYSLLWVPVIISGLQFFNLFPLQLWNATYINFTMFDGIWTPRPNGLLFHGSELSTIIVYLCIFQFFGKENKSFWLFLLLILMASFTLFKAVLAATILLFFYYLLIINKGSISKIKVISRKKLISYSLFILLFIGIVAFNFFKNVYHYTGYIFPPSILTGRGLIWNIYLEGIKDFSFWEYLVGSGIGSDYEIFKTYGTPKYYHALKQIGTPKVVYDAHNALLSIFINSGFLGLTLIFSLFKIAYSQIKNWTDDLKWNKYTYAAVFIIPIITIGITIPIFDMAIVWPTLGFILFRWKSFTKDISE